jgi:hypothetical protein
MGRKDEDLSYAVMLAASCALVRSEGYRFRALRSCICLVPFNLAFRGGLLSFPYRPPFGVTKGSAVVMGFLQPRWHDLHYVGAAMLLSCMNRCRSGSIQSMERSYFDVCIVS